MSLVFTSITPHPPIIVPNIGKENLKEVKSTVKALKELEGIIYASKPDTIISISPHGTVAPETFFINLSPEYLGHLENFGDFVTKLNLFSNSNLASKIKERAQDNDIPVNLINEPILDHGVVVPLYYLLAHLSEITLTPLSYSFLDLETHYQFGKLIQKVIMETNERVAVVASGDLSHCLTEAAPGGFSPKGKEFDEKLVDLVKNKKVKEIINLDPKFVEEAGECGLRSFIILLGILDGIKYRPEILSYEGPFGVGYLVANFNLT